jgi:phage tail protein X
MAELTNILTDDGAVWSGTAPASNEITDEGAIWRLKLEATADGAMGIVGWASARIVKVPTSVAASDPRYRTTEGDMLDAICLAELGSAEHVPAVLAANPGLADLGPVYPAGILITLPEVGAAVAPGEIRLWGESP